MSLMSALRASVVVALVFCFAAAPVAAQSRPVVTHDSITVGDAPYRECDGFVVIGGPIHLDRTFIRWYDDSGALVLERRHVQFTGTLRNSVTGASIPYSGKFMRTFDPVAGVLTLTGVFRLSVDGGRVAPISAGREVVDLSDGEIIFRAGQASFDDEICGILD